MKGKALADAVTAIVNPVDACRSRSTEGHTCSRFAGHEGDHWAYIDKNNYYRPGYTARFYYFDDNGAKV